jgi:hypothetical protein
MKLLLGKTMKYFMFLTCVFCSYAFAASNGGFKCELIKDKKVQKACVNDREAEEQKAKDAETQKAAIELEKNKAKEEEIRKADFVKNAKIFLARDFKDPMSAQFSDLRIKGVGNKVSSFDTLCGMVNAKNSYGGYVGFKPFSVQKLNDTFVSKEIIELPKETNDPKEADWNRKLAKISMSSWEQQCEGAVPYP